MTKNSTYLDGVFQTLILLLTASLLAYPPANVLSTGLTLFKPVLFLVFAGAVLSFFVSCLAIARILLARSVKSTYARIKARVMSSVLPT
jgi:hypothetical protein